MWEWKNERINNVRMKEWKNKQCENERMKNQRTCFAYMRLVFLRRLDLNEKYCNFQVFWDSEVKCASVNGINLLIDIWSSCFFSCGSKEKSLNCYFFILGIQKKVWTAILERSKQNSTYKRALLRQKKSMFFERKSNSDMSLYWIVKKAI